MHSPFYIIAPNVDEGLLNAMYCLASMYTPEVTSLDTSTIYFDLAKSWLINVLDRPSLSSVLCAILLHMYAVCVEQHAVAVFLLSAGIRMAKSMDLNKDLLVNSENYGFKEFTFIQNSE
jgi:hypothetical protein